MIKALAIAIKDLRHAFRSAMGLVFMFGLPLMVTGMFYLMFGSAARSGSFELARIRVVVANQIRTPRASSLGRELYRRGSKRTP